MIFFKDALYNRKTFNSVHGKEFLNESVCHCYFQVDVVSSGEQTIAQKVNSRINALVWPSGGLAFLLHLTQL